MNDLTRITVLLIEDEIITAKVISQQLLNEKIYVCHVHNGRGAVQILTEKKIPVDIILMDIDLGDVEDGIHIAGEILKENEIPVIFLSHHTEKEVLGRIETVESYGFVAKSSGKDVLLLSIKMALKLFSAKQEIKKRYEALRISEEKFRLFFMNIADYCYMVLPDATIGEVSNSACAVLEYTRDELIGKPVKTIYAEESIPKLERLTRQWKKMGEIRDEEMVIQAKSGVKRNVILNVNPIYGHHDEIISSISVQTDITDRRNYEKAMQYTEKYYHILFDKALDGIIILNKDGEFIDVNESFAAMHGYTVEEMRGMKLSDIDTPETLTHRSERLQDLLKGEKLVFEAAHFHKNGEIIQFGVSAFRMDIDGVPFFFGFHRDITERKKVETALRESEEKYRRIAEAVTDYMFTVKIKDGEHADTIYGNYSLAVTGYSAEEFKKNPYLWITMVHEGDKEIVKDQIVKITKTMKTSTIEHRIIRRDGSTRWVRNTAVPEFDERGALIAYNGLIQDITERKTNEETLKQHKIKYRTVADFTYDWEYWSDPLGNFLYVSPSCERITGYHPDNFMNNPFFLGDIVHPKDRELVTRHLCNTNNGRDICDFDFRIITRDGDMRWIGHRCQPVFDDTGRWLGRRGSHRDITGRKMAEEEIKKLNAHIIDLQEEERQRIAKDLHDSVSQTLSAALLNIKSYMREPGKNREQLALGIQFLESASIEIREIYTGLYPSILKHLGLVATVKWYVRHHLEANGIESELALPDETKLPHEIEVNIYRILQEVISNIVKHSRADKVRISMNNRGRGIVIEIDDNGAGFPVGKAPGDGRGFGLLNIKQRMMNMKGTLTMNSDAESGTRISMIIPLGEDDDKSDHLYRR